VVLRILQGDSGTSVDTETSVKERSIIYGQTKKRVYVGRTFGGDCHYCNIDGDIDAGTEQGQGTGQACGLS
jgi:hypothetical protein